MPDASLPPEFIAELRELERHYLAAEDPIVGSGFHGGPERWEAERRPILDAVDRDAHLLDVGCANGYLLECLVAWAAEDGYAIVPHGVDIGEELVARARKRLPAFADNLHVGNAWDWEPPRRYDVVYTIWDCVPADYLEAFVRRLLDQFVAPGGRFVLGAYGSRSRNERPFDVASFLKDIGLEVVDHRLVGAPTAAFSWVDA
ncbi:MAG TPA: class I SAM-dependent methyltransferase [Acidimicrobiia bacterium]|nr:class I SAM-dependent methyltransferase [Acidimicrobiia bacterium]